ncbi:MAG: hypothetical protein PHI96_09300 [Desulfovibrio sp.]|nr:hypothetical protein [Desulfovibrio sp.]
MQIQSKSGVRGLGWLFGAHDKGKCWIVTPAHVIASPETGELEPFYFFDGNDNTGQSALPFRIQSKAEQANRVEREAEDLAFARILSGRADGTCLSRLGLPGYAYKSILQNQEGFSIVNMFKTSYSSFAVTLARRGVDIYGGALLEFSTNDPKASPLLRQGLSGATVMADTRDNMRPVALVLRIDADKKTITALKYDYIKNLFDKGQWPALAAIRHGASEDDMLDFEIIRANYMPVPGDDGPDSLRSEAGCWKALAKGGQRTVELVFAVKGVHTKVEAVEVMMSDACGGVPVKFWLDQRPADNESWQHITGGTSSRDGSIRRVGLSGMREYRLTFDASKPVHLSRVRFH